MTDYEMQVTDEGAAYDAASKFEFPENPFTFNLPIEMDRVVVNVSYNSYHVFSTGGGIKTRNIVLNGTFHGSTRRANYNSLAQKMISTDIQRFWLDSDTFFNFYGGRIREVLNNEKNNFIDYSGTLMMTDPFIYKTSRTKTDYSVSDANEYSTSAFTNSGNADSIPRIEIKKTAGADISAILIGDGATFATSKHKITWSAPSGDNLGTNETLIIYPYKMLNESGVGDVKTTKIGYPEKFDASLVSLGHNGTMNQMGSGSQPRITAGTITQTFNITLTGCSGATTVKFYWHDAYTG